MKNRSDITQNRIPNHHPISTRPVMIDKLSSYSGIINVKFGYETDSDRFGQFYFDVEYCNFEKEYPNHRSYDLGFTIPGNCTVNISLSEKPGWRWPLITSGMTSKEKFPKSLFRDYTESRKDDGIISFKVKKDNGKSQKYYFYLNVEIEQSKGDEPWRPVSIDPWLQNPRPID